MKKIKIIIVCCLFTAGILALADSQAMGADWQPLSPGSSIGQATDPATAQGVVVKRTAHHEHINIWDFARATEYIGDPVQRQEAVDFLASHVHVIEAAGGSFAGQLKASNPDIQVFHYELDITACQHQGCYRASSPAADPPGAEEGFYLHFSEDTEFIARYVDGVTQTITIPGCPDQIRRECRVQGAIWYDTRWVYNPKNPAFRPWMAGLLLDSAELFDGIFLDEHGPGLIAGLGDDITGGGIFEYGGRTADEITDDYNADLTAALAVYHQAFAEHDKFVVINGACWSVGYPLVKDQIVAAGGTVTEFLHRPNAFDGAERYMSSLNAFDEYVAAGALVDLYDSPCRESYVNGIGMTSGNYATSFGRWQMWRLASYYIAREMPNGPAGQGTIYFDPNLCIQFSGPDPTSFIDEWLPAYDVDIGAPDGPRDSELFASGPVPDAEAPACNGQPGHPNYGVVSRSYNNGTVLILVRPADRWDCVIYDDSTIVTLDLPSPMRLLLEDGTLSEPRTSIPLRNAESAILYSTLPKLTLFAAPADRAVHLDWTVTIAVTDTLPLTTTWRMDYYTQTVTAPFTATDPLSATRAYTLTGLTNYVWYTVTLHAMLSETAWLSDTVRVMPTDRFVYLPLVLRER